MALVTFSVDDDQLTALEGLGPARRQEMRLFPEPGLAVDGEVLFDPTGELDRAIARALGSVFALMDHQGSGGSVLLGFADGSLREVHLDLGRDGVDLRQRRPSEAATRWVSRWRRARSGGSR